MYMFMCICLFRNIYTFTPSMFMTPKFYLLLNSELTGHFVFTRVTLVEGLT